MRGCKRRGTKARLTLTSLACALFCGGWLCPLAALREIPRRSWGLGAGDGAQGKRELTAVACNLFPVTCSLPGGITSTLQQGERPASGVAPQGPAQQAQPLSLEERADIFMARKAYADAADYYLRALKSRESDPVLWNKLGIAYQQQMNFNAARKMYNNAIHRRKDYPEPYNNLGTTYYLANKFKKSIKYYRKAISLNPDSASFHLNLGSSFYRIKKPKEAVDEYRQALMLDPNILNERSTTGTVVQARGGDVEYYFYLAKVFASLGRTEEAVRYLRRAFEDGFKEFKKLDEDPDFLKISQDPSYIALRSNPPVPIKD